MVINRRSERQMTNASLSHFSPCTKAQGPGYCLALVLATIRTQRGSAAFSALMKSGESGLVSELNAVTVLPSAEMMYL